MGRDELEFATPGLEPEPMEQSEWGGDWGKVPEVCRGIFLILPSG